MPKSIKLKNDTYLDSSSIMHNKQILSDILNKKVYSEEEIIIGYAIIESKKVPIYRKMLILKNLTASGNPAFFNITTIKNIDLVFRIIGNNDSKGWCTPLTMSNFSNNDVNINNYMGYSWSINKRTGLISLVLQKGSSIESPNTMERFLFIIDYTKTTD